MSWNWDPEDLSLAVRFLRALRGWTQTELAETIGWDKSRISRLESGKEVANQAELRQLAKAIGLAFYLLEITLPLLSLLRRALGKRETPGTGAAHVTIAAEAMAANVAATTRLVMTEGLAKLNLLQAGGGHDAWKEED